MSEPLKVPSPHSLPSAQVDFIGHLDRYLEFPFVHGVEQKRKFQVRYPEPLGVLADLAIIARILDGPEGELELRHSIQFMYKGNKTKKVSHSYGDDPLRQLGSLLVIMGNSAEGVEPRDPQFVRQFMLAVNESWLCPLDQNPRPLETQQVLA